MQIQILSSAIALLCLFRVNRDKLRFLQNFDSKRYNLANIYPRILKKLSSRILINIKF